MTPTQSRILNSDFCDKGEDLLYGQWSQLEEGHCVIFQRDEEPPLAGIVDMRTEDASVFWVFLNNGRGRIAVYADEGTSVWLPKTTGCDAQR
jgi:hypothetical protein